MRSLIVRRVAGSLMLMLLAAGARATDPPPKAPLTPEQQEVLLNWPQFSKIPESTWGNSQAMIDFIKKSEDDSLLNNYTNPEFTKALAIMAGVGRVRTPPANPGKVDGTPEPVKVVPVVDPVPVNRAKGEEELYRVLGREIRDQPWPYNESGKSAYRRKDYRTALNDYETAIRIDPENTTAMLGFGHSARELGDYQLASMAAKQLLARDPGNREALGLYHFANGRAPLVSVPSTIFQGGTAGPGPAGGGPGVNTGGLGAGAGSAPQGGVAAGGYNAPSQTPEQVAAAARAQAAAAGPGAAQRSAAITKDAESALRVKDFPTAHQLASQAIGLYADNVKALNYRAIASNRMHRYNDAVTDASAALALAPGNAAVLQTRSWAFAKQGLFQEALKDAEETLAREPSNPYAYQNKAMALAGMKDRAGALDALRRSAALDPRFQNQLERALQLPEDQDMSLLFDDQYTAPAAAAPPPPPRTGKRFARLAVLSGIGGILIALGILHVVSASWREKVRGTIRRALAPSEAVGSEAAEVTAAVPPGSPGTAFWLQYELIKEIGLGGMGVVYEALDRSLERRVAVKKMRDEIRIDPHERRRFVNEAKLVAQLRHPNIVDIYAIVEEGTEVYLVFEFVSGRTLGDRLKSEGPMSLEAARGVLSHVAEAVEHAHAAQIVHRDLKPSNIMITDDGRVKVMDFGVARQAKDAITKMSMTNTVVGTPPYMAPEQEQGTVRRESDVYALGVCLYEMLTGHLPFTGGGAAMLLNKLNGKHIPPSQRNPALPEGMDAVIAKALTPDPDKRYHTPSQLVAALDAVIASRA
ncbi:MAG: protein kinase [Elusimicrobia bacterium]|nr:protein kinase [Elusimicrobiota bacterium]